MSGLSDVRGKLYGDERDQARRISGSATPRLVSTLHLWLRRWNTRRALLELTPAQLKDIGLSREDAIEQGLKPFWRG